MIKNRQLQHALELLSRNTENWRWLHRAFQIFYLRAFTPLIEVYLRFATCESFRLRPRHSTLTGSGFNVFRSDIDYAIVFAAEPNADLIKQIHMCHRKIKTIFPFIGELEFYTNSEWHHKLELEKNFSAALTLIHSFRKCAWQLKIRENAPSDFHKRKAEYNLMRMADLTGQPFDVQKLKKSFECRIQFFLRSLLDRLNHQHEMNSGIEAFSDFLGWGFGTSDGPKSQMLRVTLSETECLLLASILPGETEAIDSRNQRLIENLRRQLPIKKIFAAVCQAELLLCQSVRRSQSVPDLVLDRWIDSLRSKIDSEARIEASKESNA